MLNNGDEVLIPAPDYPLWTASVALSGNAGAPVRRGDDWMPDIGISRKVTSNTKAIVVINPNNPTGATRRVLKQIVEVARQHQLIILADEVYDKTLFDGNVHTSIASLADDVLCLTFNGLSKNTAPGGYRAGWMVVSGEKRHAKDYIERPEHAGLDAAVLEHAGQLAIQTAPGRLPKHPTTWWRPVAACASSATSPTSCSRRSRRHVVKPKAALYMFPRLDPKMYHRGRPAVRPRAAGRGEGADRAGHRLQLADARPLPPRLPAQRR